MKISVVIPLFNKAPYVGRALRSVRAQALPPVEVIVVDDGSTDGGLHGVPEAADLRVQTLSSGRQGVSVARNLGVEKASGDYIAFLDADDEWRPDHLKHVATAIAAAKEPVIAGSAYTEAWSDGRETVVTAPGAGAVLPRYFWSSAHYPAIFTSSVLARRQSLRAVGGFPPGVTHGEDLDTWARLALAGGCAYSRVPTAIYYRGVPGQATASRNQSRPPILDTLQRVLRTAAVTKATAADIRFYLSTNMPNYLLARRISAEEFVACVSEHALTPFGVPAGVWRRAQAGGKLESLVAIMSRGRSVLLKRGFSRRILMRDATQARRS